MRILVMKFGGTSVADPEKIQHAADRAIGEAMVKAFAAHQVASRAEVLSIERRGVRVAAL